ncbi:MAG: VCBS repeat-containing protein [Candidatus Dormibacteraeota bacterium]|nr:VCBS repeat-containing protein [Candidatus Dormibacteraeota bacterium]
MEARKAGQLCLRTVPCGAVALALLLGGTTVAAGPPVQSAANPYSAITAGHPYRHGLVPQLDSPVFAARPAQTPASETPSNLVYGGGTNGVGVTTGSPRVYLVFWGTQWGTQGTNGSGYATFSGDPQGLAPDLQAFFKGLGTGSERWSGVMTQYCQDVSAGAQSCPASSTQRVAYPSGGALAGVWEDTAAAAPAQATGNQIGTEAVNAATHFANTTQTSNRDTQYFIVSPTGTDPDDYQSQGFCAWHDYTADGTLSGGAVNSPDGLLAFTNLPYIPDARSGCGMNFVNSGSAGTLDGVTIVGGHEYAETITDEYPAGGWIDQQGNENGDKCIWNAAGPDPSQNLSLTTGTFAVQPTWANDYNGGSGGCLISHAVLAEVAVSNPGAQANTVGSTVSLQIQASDSANQALTYSASGLPAGLSISTTSGLISGSPSTAQSTTATVTAKDGSGATGSASFPWTINDGSASGPGFSTDHAGDLAAVDASGVRVATVSGSGLNAPAAWSSSAFYGSVATLAGDVNGDGLSDLVAVNNNNVWVETSTGAQFNPPSMWRSNTPFYGSRATLLADVTGNGRADLIAVNDTSIWVMLSTGSGFSAPQQWSPGGAFYGSVATLAGRVAGPGPAALIAVNPSSTWVMTSTGSAFSRPSEWSNVPFYGSRATLLGDVTGTGYADLVAVDDGSSYVMESNGSRFGIPQVFLASAIYGSRATLLGALSGTGTEWLIAVNDSNVWVGSPTRSPSITQWGTGQFFGARATLTGG